MNKNTFLDAVYHFYNINFNFKYLCELKKLFCNLNVLQEALFWKMYVKGR